MFGEAKLFSGSKTGWQVRLAEWRHPVVIDVPTGHIDFDNFEGRWGDPEKLDRFLQAYAVEMTKIEAQNFSELAKLSANGTGRDFSLARGLCVDGKQRVHCEEALPPS